MTIEQIKAIEVTTLTNLQDEITEAVHKAYHAYYLKQVTKSQKDLINEAYEIAKMGALRDYLADRIFSINDLGSVRLGMLIQYYKEDNKLNSLLQDVYEYEMDYDEPMWCEWDKCDQIISDMLEELERKEHNG